jgi:hypothetical protein
MFPCWRATSPHPPGIPYYGYDSWDDGWGYYRPRWWLPLWRPLRPGWIAPPIFNRPGPILPIRPPPPGWRPGVPLPGWRPGHRVSLLLLLLLLILQDRFTHSYCCCGHRLCNWLHVPYAGDTSLNLPTCLLHAVTAVAFLHKRCPALPVLSWPQPPGFRPTFPLRPPGGKPWPSTKPANPIHRGPGITGGAPSTRPAGEASARINQAAM